MASVLQEVSAIYSHDSRLVWLGDVREDKVDHLDEESVVPWLSSIHDERNDVCSLLGHVQKLSAAPCREFDCVQGSSWSDNISHVRAGSSGGSSEVEYLRAWAERKVVQSSDDTGSDFTSVWVPLSVLNFLILNLEKLEAALFKILRRSRPESVWLYDTAAVAIG